MKSITKTISLVIKQKDNYHANLTRTIFNKMPFNILTQIDLVQKLKFV